MYHLSKKVIFPFLAVAALFVASLACGTIDPTPTPTPTLGDPSDYFPTASGTEWAYRIEIGEVEPLNYEEVIWSLGDGQAMRQGVRRRFVSLLEDEERKAFTLIIKVRGPATEQGPLKYPDGVELEIVKDELGIFRDAKQVFWAITSSGGFTVDEVVTYSPDTPGAPTGAWGSFGLEDGYSLRIKFFGRGPGTQIGLGDEPKDTLLFVGFEDQIPQYEGNPCPCLHFRRTVEPSEKQEGEEQFHLDKGFTEDMWFAKGKGLVRLEQKIEDATSMIWTLDESAQTSSIATPTSELQVTTSPTLRLAVEGKVLLDFYTNPVGGVGSGVMYRVEVHVKNSSATPITFDVVEGAFLTSEGKGLRAKTSQTDGSAMQLEVREEQTFEFDTNGYTSDLLTDANGGPLFFELTLFFKESIVAGPYQARLPELEELTKTSEMVLEFK